MESKNDWKAVLKQLATQFEFEYAAGMDTHSGEIMRLGDTESLHNKCLAFQLTGDAEAFTNLFDSIHGDQQPQGFTQGNEHSFSFTLDGAVLVFIEKSVRGPHEWYAFWKQIREAFAVAAGKGLG